MKRITVTNDDLADVHRPFVICVEGADGSGKSTVIRLTKEECTARGLTCELIGRTADSATQSVRDLTEFTRIFIREKKSFIPQVDFHLRLAREYLRAHSSRVSEADVVILDRFVLSVLSHMRVDGENAEFYIPHLREAAALAGLSTTVFCCCPFDVSWDRLVGEVNAGKRSGLTAKEARGPKYLKSLWQAMILDFQQLDWIGARVEIRTDIDLLDTAEEIRTKLVPLLPETHK